MGLRKQAVLADCPDCGETISVGSQPKEGQQLACSNCGAVLEIINLEPLELDWAFSEFEPDWDGEEEIWDEEDWDGTGKPSNVGLVG